METIIAFILFMMIAILIALIYVGYQLYIKNKISEENETKLSSKESELMDLYQLLEQVINETEDYLNKVKNEIANERERIESLIKEMPEKRNKNSKSSKKQKTTEEESKNDPIEIDNFKDIKEIKIKSMYKKGIAIPEIAKELNMGKGEVELILNLEKSYRNILK